MKPFLKLTEVSDNGDRDVYVNVDHMVSFTPSRTVKGGTTIILAHRDGLVVRESPQIVDDHILKLYDL